MRLTISLDVGYRSPRAARPTAGAPPGWVGVVLLGLRVVMVVLVGLTAACGGQGKQTPTGASGKESSFSVVVRDDLQSIFKNAGVRGTFVLLDVARGQTTIVDRARAERPAVPASTLKIAHSIIALEAGVVRDENEVVPYGGRQQPFKEWEKNMSIREAVPASNAAIFQEIARRIGPKRMQEWLNRFGYGNREIGPAIDRFWLDGPLKISPIEQTRFRSLLARRSLAASASTQQTIADILELERAPEHVLYGSSSSPG